MNRRVIGFIKKEFIHILRDRRTLIMIFGIPIIEILLFGYVIRTDISNINIGIVDYSNGSMSQLIVNKLKGNRYFSHVQYLNNYQEADLLFKKDKLQEVIIFDKMIEDSDSPDTSIQILLDGSNPMVSQLILSYTINVMREGDDLVFPEYRMIYNESLKSTYMFVPGVMALVLLLISAMMTAITLTKEKENHSFEMLLISPIKPIEVIIGKLTPYLILSFVNSLLILLLSKYLFHLPFLGNNASLFLLILIYILLSLGLGLLISIISKTQIVAMLFSLVVLLMPTMLLSGFIFSIANMPLPLQWLSNIMPAKWFIICFKGIVVQGLGLHDLFYPFLILVVMTVALILISVNKYSTYLDD